jgi:hypothetical protein
MEYPKTPDFMLIPYLLKWAQKMFTKNVLSKHYDNFEFLDFALFSFVFFLFHQYLVSELLDPNL